MADQAVRILLQPTLAYQIADACFLHALQCTCCTSSIVNVTGPQYVERLTFLPVTFFVLLRTTGTGHAAA